MRTLIAGTSYIRDLDSLWLASQWGRVTRTLNPNSDILVVDTPGPMDWNVGELLPDTETSRYRWYRFHDNLGDLQKDGRDGWGRATMFALNLAVKTEYDYIALYDLDVLMCKAMEPTLDYMTQEGWKVASTRCSAHGWLEGIELLSVPYIRESNLIARYNWESMRAGVFPERRLEEIFGWDLRIIDLIGLRDDHQTLTPQNIWKLFPNGLDYLTHNKNMDVYREVLKRYGLTEAAPGITLT